jgi:hypothetical protein
MNEFNAARKAAVSFAFTRKHKTFFLLPTQTLQRVESGRDSSGINARCTASASLGLRNANSNTALASSALVMKSSKPNHVKHCAHEFRI